MPRTLDAAEIAATVETLSHRIDERFPGSSLSRLCRELLEVARGASQQCLLLARPLLGLRSLEILGIAALVLGPLWLLFSAPRPDRIVDAARLVQLLEPAMNIVVLIGAAVVFLLSVERRVKLRRALRAMHELRSLAHLVDAHQLTKDPERMLIAGPDTPSSPRRPLSSFELGRYLGYCSEMLALVGKISALYAERLDDPVALEAADGIEALSTGLSRKIWQKIVLLQEMGPEAGAGLVAPGGPPGRRN